MCHHLRTKLQLQLGQIFNGGKLAFANIYSAGEVKQSPNSSLGVLIYTLKSVLKTQTAAQASVSKTVM